MCSEVKYFAHIKARCTCPECGNPIFLNGPSLKMFCHSCLKEFKLDKSLPIEFVKTCFDEIKESPMKESGYGYTNYEYMFGNKPPTCPECDEKIPKEKLIVQEGKDNWEIICEKCKNSIPVSKVPKWIKKKVNAAEIIINAEIYNEQMDNKPKPSELKGVVFSCPKCSGSLDIDGTDRIVKCEYCNSNVYLPDDLWIRLHPVKTVGTWYVGFSTIESAKKRERITARKAKNIKDKENLEKIKLEIKILNNKLENLGIFKGKEKKEIIEKISLKENELKKVQKKIERNNYIIKYG